MAAEMHLGEGAVYSLDTHKTHLNNNVLVVGTSGSGKTRSIVSPNILEAEGSYVISDPKGSLYLKYGNYLKSRGYKVRTLNFADLKKSDCWNFFDYIHTEQDILKAAHMLVMIGGDRRNTTADPFWDEAAELLLTSLIAYEMEADLKERRSLEKINRLASMMTVDEDSPDTESQLDVRMNNLFLKKPGSFAVKQFRKFRIAAGRTMKSILISLFSYIGRFDFNDCNRVMAYDEMRIADIGNEKTAVFVIVSDTDRSMDGLANIFFSQAMNELCRAADSRKDGRLPVPVRFILDDFATNVKINEFPRMIASIRSREISTILIIQSFSQLTACYGEDGKTIRSNCDTMVYLAGTTGRQHLKWQRTLTDRLTKCSSCRLICIG